MSKKRVHGIVKWVNTEKGFGFIESSSATYTFIPSSAIQALDYRELIEGERVTFIVTLGHSGPQASQIMRSG